MLFGYRFVRRQLSFVSAGIFDKIFSRLTGRKISFGKICVIKLMECEPWTDHFSPVSINSISEALLDGDFKSARLLAAISSLDAEKSAYCIKLLEKEYN